MILCESDVISGEYLAVTRNVLTERKNGFPQLQEIEKDYILSVLKQTGGNQTKASRLLGVDRKTLYHKLKRYGITT